MTAKYVYFLAALALIFFLPFLISPSKLTAKDNDLGRTYIPIYQDFKYSVIHDNEIPIWSRMQMMGQSQSASPLPALFYPVNLIFLLLPVNFAAVLYLMIHVFFSAVFTFFLSRFFKFSNPSSFAAAVIYAFSTKSLLHISAGHITMVAAFSYFPLVFLSLAEIIRNNNFKWVIILAISLSLILFTHPTVFYYSALFVFIYILYFILKTILKKTTHDLSGVLISLTKCFCLFLLLSAVATVPYLEFNSFSNRSTLTLEEIAVPIWNLKLFISSLIFPYPNLLILDHESLLYLGLVPLVLSLLAFKRLHIMQKIFLFVSSLAAIIFVLGTSTPFFAVLYKFIPLLNYSRVTTRPWFIVALVAALLSAFLLNKVNNRKTIYLLIALFILESSLLFYQKLASVPELDFSNVKLYEFLKNDKDQFRVYCTANCFNPQLLSQYKIQLLNGETPIQNKNFVNFLQKAGNYSYSQFAVIFPPYQIWQVPNPPVPDSLSLGEANVKYVASTYKIENPDFIPMGNFEEIYLYLNKNFKPKAYILNSQKQVSIKSQSANAIFIALEKSSVPETLIISENYFPGFVAKIGNQKYKVESYKEVFQKIAIPPNTASVEVRYQPQSLLFGKTLTVAAALFIGMCFWYKKGRSSMQQERKIIRH